MIKIKRILIILLILSNQFSLIAKIPPKLKKIEWKLLEKGLYLAEVKAPRITKISDSKVTILKIDPKFFSFHLISASEHDSMQRTVKEWSEMNGLIAAINAGMYGGKSHISNVGFMKNHNHVNNPELKPGFLAVAAFNPVDSTLPPFKIIDLQNESWETYKDKYNSFSQSMRMIDNQRKPLEWIQKRKMRSSMVVLATDKKGNVLFIFTRSPYTPNEFIKIMLKMPVDIQSAMYLEGGPESSLYVNDAGVVVEKIGSYVSRTFAHDRNMEFRKMPNVIGIKRK
ncbi:MAG: phosphodiester glycosidase family protein [Bacteroidetes bacterium]|nr:phosphodiester glycosidase family protein [Bacteroidota bacterium]